ncbi:UDP-2-acetamido-2,6-dideoxy-hexulose 4-reductase [Paenibacillus baekrokdamisoli]|uniref:UDP-2-acetamido-2,6-dideoxy-hexulose 4-reductase n=1 Tax=Paenibacillus baekrokdamisoli TaxID=1712516 RepID=A0A3G9IKK8_9BACL|nr:NAD-dependent epimerase/dehydratase family protein [Paenibacillus baekrokdamisoli]MBB3069328.1 GDP-4-dehydro-6-deoxy-D-mannose reductase [Paenibacillus baekrokdamisoli]BBH18702.1 UDP-2-acetamido-2,6-dideoxy-hexulose 4-reductase [Paenibacillus baekrokdamisoli]
MDEGNLSRPRLVITGAGGFSGEHACRYFSAKGWEVTAVLRRQTAGLLPEWLQHVAAVTYCDFSSREETEACIQHAQPEYVLHLAGMNAVDSSWRDPITALQSNVMGTVHLMEAVRQAGLPCRVLVVGSMLRFKLPLVGEDGIPPHPYSLSKTMQVLTVQSWASLYGLDVMAAEPANLIGPGRSTGLCALMARYTAESEHCSANGMQLPRPFRLSSRTEQRDLLDVRDAVRAYELLLMMGERGQVYPVTSGTMRSLGELVDLFDLIGKQPLHWEIGQSQALSPIPEEPEAIRKLGWLPQLTLEQSLRDALNEARRNY